MENLFFNKHLSHEDGVRAGCQVGLEEPDKELRLKVGPKARIGCHDEESRRAWRSRRSKIGIKFIDPMNHTYTV